MRLVQVGSRLIGEGQPVYVVAEAGVAHFGDVEQARRLIDLAVEAGADAVKFQIYKTASLIAASEQQWRERLGAKELRYEDFKSLQQYAVGRGVDFFATPHEEEALAYLVGELHVPLLKVGSGEVGNLRFLKRVAAAMLPTIVSLGLHNEEDIQQVVEVFKEAGNEQLILLHCVTRYPTPAGESNLRTISWLAKRYDCPIGYSDHTAGHAVPLAAVALGARVIEKHVFLDRHVPGSQDALVACDASDFKQFVEEIRAVESALGVEGQNPHMERMANRDWARKSVVAARPLKRGRRLVREDLVLKRPGRGIAPEHVEALVGRILTRDVTEDDLLQWTDLEG